MWKKKQTKLSSFHRFPSSTGTCAQRGSSPWSLRRGVRSTTGTTWRNTASMSTRYCMLLGLLCAAVCRLHKIIVYWLMMWVLSHTRVHTQTLTAWQHSLHTENGMLAAAVASVLCLQRMRSGTVMSAGQTWFDSAQSTIHSQLNP